MDVFKMSEKESKHMGMDKSSTKQDGKWKSTLCEHGQSS